VSDADADLGQPPSDGNVKETPNVVEEAEPLTEQLLMGLVMDVGQLYAAVTEYQEEVDNSDPADAKDDTLINAHTNGRYSRARPGMASKHPLASFT
jgi:hypothetical protein